MNKVIESELRSPVRIGLSGVIGISTIDGSVITFVALVGSDEMDESSDTICDALAVSFGSESDPKVELLTDGRRQCVFKKNIGGEMRDPRALTLSVQRRFIEMVERLKESVPSACG